MELSKEIIQRIEMEAQMRFPRQLKSVKGAREEGYIVGAKSEAIRSQQLVEALELFAGDESMAVYAAVDEHFKEVWEYCKLTVNQYNNLK